MTFGTLILRSLRFHWRGHLGVMLGAAVGSAALIGALVVGDSVRGSLRETALQRLGWVDAAMAPVDRFFTQALSSELNLHDAKGTSDPSFARVVGLLKLPGTAARQDGTARANQVNVLGVSEDFWRTSVAAGVPPSGSGIRRGNEAIVPASTLFFTAVGTPVSTIPPGSVLLNEPLAAQLNAKPGDDVVLRIHKPTALSREVPITPQNDASVALRLKVHAILPAAQWGNFSLQASQSPALNAFLSLAELARAAALDGKANVQLAGRQDRVARSARQLTRDALPGEALSWRENLMLENFEIAPARARRLMDDENRSRRLAVWQNERLKSHHSLADLGMELRLPPGAGHLELLSSRIFLDPSMQTAALEADRAAQGVLTYLVNQLRAGTNAVPYSMVSAVGAPWTPADLRDDEIIVNRWLADDLHLQAGDILDLTYFLAESGARLTEQTNRFRVRAIVPLTGLYADRTFMPEFPGLSKAESTQEWDAGFPLVHKIRDQDEAYWKQYRGTPKAFVTLAAGQGMWGNRFGNLTAIRFRVPPAMGATNFLTQVERSLLGSIEPASLGLRFEPVRAQALAGSAQAQDFGGLFLGFSFFLILAALILMALLFQFGLEQRTTEIGTLLALGFTPARVRRFFLREGMIVAFVGGGLGVLGGLGYARAVLHLLTTLWRDAVGGSALRFHVTGATLCLGWCASLVVCVVTIWFVLRKQGRRPARELLAEGSGLEAASARSPKSKRRWAGRLGGACAVVALALMAWSFAAGERASAETFFGAGSLLLLAGLAGVSALLTALDRAGASRRLSLAGLGLRGCTRRRTRSLASVALLACGSFLVVAVGANRLDAGRDASKRSSGTGGFALLGESTLPIVRDLNAQAGREFFGLDEATMRGVSVVPFRVRDGDEASCLNLNRAQTPRLLGVKPELLAERGAFTFSGVARGLNPADGWKLLRSGTADPKPGTQNPEPGTIEIPVIGDAASIQWALGKKLGDTLDYTDERGQTFKIRIVGAVANSILQGSLIMDEAAFLKRFPSEAGHRMFLIDTPSNEHAAVEKVSAGLTRALQDVGLEVTPAAQRLAAFNAVQNTYLNTFQVLGGLGLLLGSAGLGVVVLRNVLERRGELALLQAVGFRRRALHWLVLSEHGGLLLFGLGVGMVAALAAVVPVLIAPGAEIHFVALAVTLAGVLASGLAWTWVATQAALRGRLLDAVRNE